MSPPALLITSLCLIAFLAIAYGVPWLLTRPHRDTRSTTPPKSRPVDPLSPESLTAPGFLDGQCDFCGAFRKRPTDTCCWCCSALYTDPAIDVTETPAVDEREAS